MKKKRILIATIALLNLVIISSIGLSFAWYNTAATLYVSGLDVSFSGGPDLKIGLKSKETNEIDFKETINADELNKVDAFIPVSSSFSYKWIKNHEEYPKFKEGYASGNHDFIETYRENKDASSGYFSQEFYLKSDFNTYVSIAEDSTVLADTIKNSNKELLEIVKKHYPTLSESERLQALNDVIKSLRISILVSDESDYSYTIIDPYKNKNETTYLFGTLDNNADGYYDYYFNQKDNKYYSILYGDYEIEDNIKYLDSNNIDSNLIKIDKSNFPSSFNSKIKANTHHIKIDEDLKDKINGKTEVSYSLNEISNMNLIRLDEYKPKRIVISIYLEGWDLDCTNLSMLGNFSADIKFKITKEII